jgi:SpoVK/Ycf46/Vps4 family AAA+-type ATPase
VFVDLPTVEDRADIFKVHLAKRGRAPLAFDLELLAPASEGLSGAEIEAAVKAALLEAFMDGVRALTTEDVLKRVRAIRPTSEVKREAIEELRKWAREHLAIDAVRGQHTDLERRLEF